MYLIHQVIFPKTVVFVIRIIILEYVALGN